MFSNDIGHFSKPNFKFLKKGHFYLKPACFFSCNESRKPGLDVIALRSSPLTEAHYTIVKVETINVLEVE